MDGLNLSQLGLLIEITIVRCCLDGEYNTTVFEQLKNVGLVDGDVRKCTLTEKGDAVVNALWLAADEKLKNYKP